MDLLNNVSNQVATLVPNQLNVLLSNPFVIFPVVVMLQGIFGGKGVVLVPAAVSNLANSPVTRMLLLTLVGFAATRNIALALVGAVVFALVLFLLRNEEERDAAPMF